MAKTKTQTTQANVLDFINSFANTQQKRQDSLDLVQKQNNKRLQDL